MTINENEKSKPTDSDVASLLFAAKTLLTSYTNEFGKLNSNLAAEIKAIVDEYSK